MELTVEQAQEYERRMNDAMYAAVNERFRTGPKEAAEVLLAKQREVAAWLFENGYVTESEFAEIHNMMALGYREYLRANGIEPEPAAGA